MASNDVAAVVSGYQKYRRALIERGMEAYELRPDSTDKSRWSLLSSKSRSGLHTKAMIVDREHVVIGSYNLDPRSADINSECALLVGSARQLVRFGDSHDFLHALQHFQQPRVELPLPADGADHRAQGAGRPMDVESHLHELGDHALDLFVGRQLLHDHNHGVPALSVYRIVRLFLALGDALEPSRLIDDPFEQPADGAVVERPTVDRGDVGQDLRLARRLIDLDAGLALDPPHLEGGFGAGRQQPDQLLVEIVDALPQRLEQCYNPLFSHRTYSPTC
jgi:hypothetical protein